jgi:hypothetical protein
MKTLSETNTGTITIDCCKICLGLGYYRDFNGVYHNCPKCNIEQWKITC